MEVKDPVCGMTIDSIAAFASETRESQTYYFCSAVCHDKFRATPDRYVGKAEAKRYDPKDVRMRRRHGRWRARRGHGTYSLADDAFDDAPDNASKRDELDGVFCRNPSGLFTD